jgi:hypothetical protein
MRDLEAMYGAAPDRCIAAMGPVDALETIAKAGTKNLSQVADWIDARVGAA